MCGLLCTFCYLKFAPHIFRILLLRPLRLALPPSARHCRCRRTLDPLGDLRSACAYAAALQHLLQPRRTRRAAARVCREAGSRVTTNTRRMDFHLDDIQRQDDRRIGVIASGPLPGRGVQLAIDTALVSPLTRASKPRTRAGRYAGAAPAMCWPRVPPPPHRPPADSAPRPKEQCLDLASSPCVSGAAYIHGTCHAHA